MVGPKEQDFWPRINILKGIFFKKFRWWITVRQKVPKSYFQDQFSMSKINRIFSKKKSFQNINLGAQFLLKTVFPRLNFWTTLFSKIMPIFLWTDIPRSIFVNFFPCSYVDSCPKIFLFRTHHLKNSTTELILMCYSHFGNGVRNYAMGFY